MLLYGLRWRIGDGRQVKVLQDKWVENPPEFAPISDRRNISEDMLVADLMNGDGTSWNVDLIYSDFAEDEAAAILQIPLSYRLRNDLLLWHFDNKGTYSVRSGYRVLRNLQNDEEDADMVEVNEEKGILRRLWGAEVPPKVRVFAWRLYHAALPVMENLHARHMVVERPCFRCKRENQRVSHAIRSCFYVTEVWSHVWNLFVHDEANRGVDLDLVDDLDHEKDEDWFHLGMFTSWAIWGARNKALYDEKDSRPFDKASFAFSYFKEFARSREAVMINMAREPPRCKPPTNACVKINFDTAVLAERKISAYGIIPRYSAGLALGACSCKILNV